jgi:hypothetical protein
MQLVIFLPIFNALCMRPKINVMERKWKNLEFRSNLNKAIVENKLDWAFGCRNIASRVSTDLFAWTTSTLFFSEWTIFFLSQQISIKPNFSETNQGDSHKLLPNKNGQSSFKKALINWLVAAAVARSSGVKGVLVWHVSTTVLTH